MMDPEYERLEQALARAGQSIRYPATPALAVRVRARLDEDSRRSSAPFRLPWLTPRLRAALALAAALVIAVALLLAFPETRQAVAQWLGLRTIQIIPATPTAPIPPSPSPRAGGAGAVPRTATPSSGATGAPAPVNQCCETTLDDALARVKFKVLLPPGQAPSKVYFQELTNFGPGAQQVILVFGDPAQPTQVVYQAHSFLYGKVISQFSSKTGSGTVIDEVQVRGARALWFSGAPHILIYVDRNGRPVVGAERPVNANTLAWEEGEITYRVETASSLTEAIQFAESLR